MTTPQGPVVIKFGGELLEPGEALALLAQAVARLASTTPVLVVHGGGREIDAEATRRGLTKRVVDGLRITDAATLEAVIAVLAGVVNTRLVSALVAAGVRAVGLTGADAALVPVERAAPHRAVDGRVVDLGLVGRPLGGAATLAADLLASAYVPVVASLGIEAASGQVFNVNADTLAAHLAVALGARRLVVVGTTPGVLDREGRAIASLDLRAIDRLLGDGTASAGMIAKLVACHHAIDAGVDEVVVASGRAFVAAGRIEGTRIVRDHVATTAGDRTS